MSSCIYSCSSTPLQLVAGEALTYPDEVVTHINQMCTFFSKLGKYCYSRFNAMELISSKPFAAWYIFIDFSNYRNKLFKREIENSQALVQQLINDIGLVTVSGESFGYKYLTLRYSFIDVINPETDMLYEKKIINITKGLDRLDKWLKRL